MAIRQMMSAPAKKAPPKKEEVKPEAKAAVDAKALKGTLHKPAAGSTPAKPAKQGTGAPSSTAPGGNKEVKSAKLSSSWAG
ncbi:MAG TPA: hypothetical protein VGP90_05265, partial [Acidimicrobiia bacterium]|nr:hypothetical protein [Acidimicrobiia bacterium]